MKSQGSRKINAFYYAQIKKVIYNDQKIEATFSKIHCGHLEDLQHIKRECIDIAAGLQISETSVGIR